MTNTTAARWFEDLTETVAHYISDDVSEVYAMRPDARYFARVREDDGTFVVTLLTNDHAELIGGEARLIGLPETVVGEMIEAMLR
jgi:hypothetical protein